MRARSLIPQRAGSVPEPSTEGALLRMLAVGVCGTDREVLDGEYGSAPPGREYLVLGHESPCEGSEQLCALDPDVVIECTGAAPVIATVIGNNAANGIVCLTGLSSGTQR